MLEQPAAEDAFEVCVGKGNGLGAAHSDAEAPAIVRHHVRRVVDGHYVGGVLAGEPAAAGTHVGYRALAPESGVVKEPAPVHLHLPGDSLTGGEYVLSI